MKMTSRVSLLEQLIANRRIIKGRVYENNTGRQIIEDRVLEKEVLKGNATDTTLNRKLPTRNDKVDAQTAQLAALNVAQLASDTRMKALLAEYQATGVLTVELRDRLTEIRNALQLQNAVAATPGTAPPQPALIPSAPPLPASAPTSAALIPSAPPLPASASPLPASVPTSAAIVLPKPRTMTLDEFYNIMFSPYIRNMGIKLYDRHSGDRVYNIERAGLKSTVGKLLGMKAIDNMADFYKAVDVTLFNFDGSVSKFPSMSLGLRTLFMIPSQYKKKDIDLIAKNAEKFYLEYDDCKLYHAYMHKFIIDSKLISGSHAYDDFGNMKTATNFMKAIEKGQIVFDNAAASITGAGASHAVGSSMGKPRSSGQALVPRGAVQYYRNPMELTTRLASLLGIYVAGNRGIANRNEIRGIADRLLEDKAITETQHAKFYRM